MASPFASPKGEAYDVRTDFSDFWERKVGLGTSAAAATPALRKRDTGPHQCGDTVHSIKRFFVLGGTGIIGTKSREKLLHASV